jgi:hypothetical protein
MEQILSWEAYSYLARQESLPPFMEPDSVLPCSQEPATSPLLKSDASSSQIPTLFP